MLQLILYAGIICLAGYGSKIGFKEESQWLSKNQTGKMKGVCALLVIVHHISSVGTASGSLQQFWYFAVLSGYLLVGYFFFVSGYGIAYSEYQSDKKKEKSRLLKRCISISIPYAVITIIYLLYYIMSNQDIGIKEMWKGFIVGEPVVRYSWYSIAIILLYVLFSISTLIKEKTIAILSFFLLVLGYVIFFASIGFSEFWYNAVLAMIMGIMIATCKKQIYSWLKKNSVLKLVVTCMIFGVMCLTQIKLGNALYEKNLIIFWIVKELCLVAFIIILMYLDLYVSIGNRALEWIANISYEIYLTHGFVMMLVSEILHWDVNGVLYSVSVIGITIILSWVEHHINKRALKIIWRKIR